MEEQGGGAAKERRGEQATSFLLSISLWTEATDPLGSHY